MRFDVIYYFTLFILAMFILLVAVIYKSNTSSESKEIIDNFYGCIDSCMIRETGECNLDDMTYCNFDKSLDRGIYDQCFNDCAKLYNDSIVIQYR